MLADLGWTVVDADDLARQVLATVSAEVKRRWPRAVRNSVIDRQVLAEIVFSDARERQALEDLIYPSLGIALDSWADMASLPAAVEISSPSYLHRMASQRLVVDAPDDIRRARAVSRGMDVDDVDRRMWAQPARPVWLELATYVIENRHDPATTEGAVRLFDVRWGQQ
jgi:dephospho-CoA kinase